MAPASRETSAVSCNTSTADDEIGARKELSVHFEKEGLFQFENALSSAQRGVEDNFVHFKRATFERFHRKRHSLLRSNAWTMSTLTL